MKHGETHRTRPRRKHPQQHPRRYLQACLRKPRRRLLPCLLAACVALSPASLQAAPADDPRARMEQLDADLERLEKWLQSSRIDRDALADELRTGDLAVAELAAGVRRAEARIAAQRQRITAAETEIARLEALEAQQREALLDQLRSAWLLARRDPLQIMLEAETPDRLGRLLHFHRLLTETRLAAIEDWEQSRRALDAQRDVLEEETEVLRAERDALATRAAGLERARRERAGVLAALEARIAAREDTRAQLRADRQRLAELLERLSREAQQPSGAAFAAARGQLPWPVAPTIIQAFGASRGPGQLPADGVLLRADAGTEVRAVAAGQVVFADWMRGFGLLVIVDHGGGFMSLYGQAESVLRGPGARVEAGESIATAGQSGGGGRAGLWFEIRRAGKPEDPVTWCVPRGRG